VTAPEPDYAGPPEDARTAAQNIVAALGLPDLSEAPSEPIRPLPLIDLYRLSRDTTVLYSVGRVDASGRVKSIDIVRALGWQAGDKLEVATALGGIVIIASPDGLFSMPHQPCIVIPAAARHLGRPLQPDTSGCKIPARARRDTADRSPVLHGSKGRAVGRVSQLAASQVVYAR